MILALKAIHMFATSPDRTRASEECQTLLECSQYLAFALKLFDEFLFNIDVVVNVANPKKVQNLNEQDMPFGIDLLEYITRTYFIS